MPTSSSLKMEKQAWWHQQIRTEGCRFHQKDSLLDSAGPCSLGQAVGPVVTQEGMPLTSCGHARELLSTCQQVTSYDNQMRANLWMLCVTAYLDLGLSFQGLSFTFAWAYSQGPSCVPCLCVRVQTAVPPRARAWLSPRGNAEPCQGTAVSHLSALLTPACTASPYALVLTSWPAMWVTMPPFPVGTLNSHSWYCPGLWCTFQQERGLLTDNCWYNKILSSPGCRNRQNITASTGLRAVGEPPKGQRSLQVLRPLTPASGVSPADLVRTESLMDLI